MEGVERVDLNVGEMCDLTAIEITGQLLDEPVSMRSGRRYRAGPTSA